MAELGLRLFDPLGLSYFAEARRYFLSMQPDDAYSYLHTPGFRGRFQGVDVAINSAGFRGPEVEVANPRARMRVLVLGDSVVFGWGAPQDVIFPIRLQRMLERVVPEVEVIPAGVGSWNTRTEYEYLRSRGVHFRPDVILLLVTANDLDPHRAGRTDIPKNVLFARDTVEGAGSRVWKAAVRRSYLMAYVQYVRRKHDTAPQGSHANAESPRWEDARLALDGMVRLARETGAVLLTALYGSTVTIETSAVLRLYRDHLKTKGIECITLPEELFTDSRLHNSIIDTHPNSDGHAVIARQLYEHVMPVVTALEDRKHTGQGTDGNAVNPRPQRER